MVTEEFLNSSPLMDTQNLHMEQSPLDKNPKTS